MKTINDYAELVKEKHALNKTIAPVETDLTDASRGYHIGEQFIIDGGLFKAKTEIEQHDALVLNTNYEPADNLTEQIKNAGGGTGTDPRLDVFEKNIAPVETDETDASQPYQVGEQLILNNILYDVISPISEHDVITTTGSGANIAPADPISSQFQTLTNQVSDISDEIADMNNVLGAKNLLPNEAKTQTFNGVTFTANADGTVTVNGTATVDTYYEVQYRGFKLPNKSLILSGCPSGGSALTYNLHVRSAEADSSQWQYYIDYGDSTSFVADNNRVYVCNIGVMQGQTVSNLVFKPMLRPASIQDDTYVPYSMTNREMTPYVQAISNPNLLDNPWFTVNQRGFTNSTVLGYCADRWKIAYNPDNSPVSLANDILTIDHTSGSTDRVYIIQQFEQDYSNLELTASVLLSDGTILKGAGIMPSLNGTDVGVIDTNEIYVYLQHSTSGSSGYCCLGIAVKIGQSVSIKAVKLELGSVSTLAMDTAPNYATELMKCQRYFVRIGGTLGIGQGFSGYGLSASSARCILWKGLRTMPTISFSNITDFVLFYDGKQASVTNFSIAASDKDFVNIRVDIAETDLQYYPCFLRFNVGNSYIDLSADL